MTEGGRGGTREGAGRPKGTTKPEGVRKQRQLRAYDEEWEIIKEFSRILKKDPERAARMMKLD
nr:hypothetical protein [uncultured Selenomonas sp.]